MGAARSNRDRVLQIARWLAVTFPTPFPTVVKPVKKIAAMPGADSLQRRIGDYGETYRQGPKIIIRIAVRPGISRSSVVDSILHEWAHALQGDRRMECVGGHDDEWALAYGRIYRRFHDDGGSTASAEY